MIAATKWNTAVMATVVTASMGVAVAGVLASDIVVPEAAATPDEKKGKMILIKLCFL